MRELMESLAEQNEDLLAPPPDAKAVVCSIIVPVYEEEENIPLLHERIASAMESLGTSYEVIYVDDGSRDSSFARLNEIVAADPHATVIQFRRNFGQTAALAAGIANSCGEVLVFMDADLQNDPADIPRLLARIDEGFDVVSGWRVNRQDAALSRKLPSKLANTLISVVTGVHLHDYGCTLKAYRREVIDHIHLYGEMHRFIPAHAAWVGATITEVPVQHHPRIHGRSKYGIARTMKVVLDLLTVKFLGSYSTKPIYVFGGLGFSSITLSVVSIVIALLDKFVNNVSLIQSPLLLLSAMLFIIGIELVLMGFLAEISVRTYHESQSKPTYVVRRIVRHDK
jgi:glycosyltransferase involved in cell wall biosynthesis